MQQEITHDLLCEKAAQRLKSKYHNVLLAEPKNIVTLEIPDVIGWKNDGTSTVVECKISLADFLRDKKKMFRRCMSLGMGDYRIYFCQAGLIHVDDVHESWGLWWLYPSGRILAKKKPKRMEPNKFEELKLTLWALREGGRGLEWAKSSSLK